MLQPSGIVVRWLRDLLYFGCNGSTFFQYVVEVNCSQGNDIKVLLTLNQLTAVGVIQATYLILASVSRSQSLSISKY